MAPRRNSVGSLLSWVGKTGEHKLKAESRHIDRKSGAITEGHGAFVYLRDMRSDGIQKHVIDRMGNFVDLQQATDPKAPTRSLSMLPSWEHEFLTVEYRREAFTNWMSIMIIVQLINGLGLVYAPLGTMVEHCPAHNLPSKGRLWAFLQYSPFFISSLITFHMGKIMEKMTKDDMIRWYPRLVLMWVLMIYILNFYVGFVREFTRRRGERRRVLGVATGCGSCLGADGRAWAVVGVSLYAARSPGTSVDKVVRGTHVI